VLIASFGSTGSDSLNHEETKMKPEMKTRKCLHNEGATIAYNAKGHDIGLLLDGELWVAPTNEYGHPLYLGDIGNWECVVLWKEENGLSL